MAQMTVSAPHLPLRSALWLAFFGWLLPVVALISIGKMLPALAVMAAPIILLVSLPEGCLYILILSIASSYGPVTIAGFVPMACDAGFALLFGAVVLDYLLHVRTTIRSTPVDGAFLALIAATFISAVFAHNPASSLVPSARIVVVYLAFRAIYSVVTQVGVRRVLMFFIVFVFFLSAGNCVAFVLTGGHERIWGPAWLAFEIMAPVALSMAIAFAIWARSKGEQLRFLAMSLVILFAIFATQSRGPLVTAVSAVPVLLFFARAKIRREGTVLPGLRAETMVTIVTVVGVAVLIPLAAYFLGFFGRVEELLASAKRPQGTVALRLVLWKAALRGFMTSPITGIGIGNFRIIDQIIPELRAEPVWYYIHGMSAHNVVLHYLAETGVLGLGALLAVTYKGVKMAWNFFRRPLGLADSQVSGALFITMFIFASTIFYIRAWTWGQEGYLMALFFALTAAWWVESRGRSVHAE